jgi:ceramide glucosyltransferase
MPAGIAPYALQCLHAAILLLLLLAAAGIAYTLAAACCLWTFRARPVLDLAEHSAISLLKPLCGAEPRLYDNLQTWLAQDYPAAVQIIFGVQSADDPAIAVVQQLQAAHPQKDITLVVNAQPHGANLKIANLINMAVHIRHPLLVLADSDIAAPPDCLRRLALALAQPRVGLANCLYFGRGDAGFWSVLAAMDSSTRFMPSVALASRTGLEQPCLGAVMALRADTLQATGGLAAFADVLADDYALGQAVRALGLQVVMPPGSVIHCADERSFSALVQHELRWNRTVFRLNPAGFCGSLVLHCLPLALLAWLLALLAGSGIAIWAAWALVVALAVRVLLVGTVDRVAGFRSGPLWWLPLRDTLSLALFIATFFSRKVAWRGAQFQVARNGRISAKSRDNSGGKSK